MPPIRWYNLVLSQHTLQGGHGPILQVLLQQSAHDGLWEVLGPLGIQCIGEATELTCAQLKPVPNDAQLRQQLLVLFLVEARLFSLLLPCHTNRLQAGDDVSWDL